jgi:branched-chain amino acid transport system permease protein
VKAGPYTRALLAAAWAALVAFPLAGIGMRDRVATGPDGVSRTEWVAFLRPEPLWIGLGVLVAIALVKGLGRAGRLVPEAWRPGVLAARVGAYAGATTNRRIAAGIAGAAALALVPDLFGSQGEKYAQICFDACLWMLLALGLNIVVGMAGLLVLGYAAFLNVGAYTFAILSCRFGWTFWQCLPAGAAAGALCGLALGLPSLRLRGDYLAIVTLGFGETLRYVLVQESAWTGGPDGIPCSAIPGAPAATTSILAYDRSLLFRTQELHGSIGGRLQLFLHAGMDDPYVAYYIGLAFLAVGILLATRLSHSRIGRALFALREDETAARAMGISTSRTKILAFTISAAWAAVVGVLAVGRKNQITPDDYKFEASVPVLSMVVLGGMGSVRGAVLGAALLHFVPILLQEAFPAFQGYRLLLFGAVMIVLMVVRPQGLFGSLRKAPASAEADEAAARAAAGAP